MTLKASYEIIDGRLRGLKHFDLAVSRTSKSFILNLAIQLYQTKIAHYSRLYPEKFDANGQPIFSPWRFLQEILYQAILRGLTNTKVRLTFNLDEALTEAELETLARRLAITEPYQPYYSRRRQPRPPQAAVLTTPQEFLVCNSGLYKIGWKNGGHSFASVGRLESGRPWMAPADWGNGSCALSRYVEEIATMERLDLEPA